MTKRVLVMAMLGMLACKKSETRDVPSQKVQEAPPVKVQEAPPQPVAAPAKPVDSPPPQMVPVPVDQKGVPDCEALWNHHLTLVLLDLEKGEAEREQLRADMKPTENVFMASCGQAGYSAKYKKCLAQTKTRGAWQTCREQSPRRR